MACDDNVRCKAYMSFSDDCQCTVEGTAEFVTNVTKLFLIAAKLIPSDGITETTSWMDTIADKALAEWKAGRTIACPCEETTGTAL
jgi:hypothetical protein